MAKIINVSNRLPITIGKKIVKSSGGLVSALEPIRKDCKMLWIGWPGKTISDKTKQQQIRAMLAAEHNCVPIFLSKEELNGYYHGFSNSTLWPLLHYRAQYIRHKSGWWDHYKQVNQKFAAAVLKIARPGDMIWVHDYHLMLLPQMLKDEMKNLKIGFFLHTPFPSYEVFKCHPQRKELLAGLISADLAGFHTFGYMRHFRSSVMRLLEAECETTVLTQHQRNCHIGVFPIGADVDAFTEELKTEKFAKKLADFKKTYKDKKIVLSVERLDYSKGIVRRLEAIDRFLSKWPKKDEIVFIFIAIPSRGEVPEYIRLRQEVESLVGRLNGKHATVENIPIHFINKSVNFTGLCALYRLADVAMVTPLVDGMNLVAKEFVACRPDYTGILILSEFTGAADELFQAFLVNPYDVDAMTDSLWLALTIDKDDISRRMEGMYKRVTKFDSKYWAKSFIDELSKISPPTHTVNKRVNIKTEFTKKISDSTQTAFFIDYDGTLKVFENDPEKASPNAKIKKLMAALSRKKTVDTYIISGRKAGQLTDWLGEYNVTLIAEHGFNYRKAKAKRWQAFSRGLDLSWKEHVREMFAQYCGTTPGSFVEEKASAIVWHYRRADPEFGHLKAEQLIALLQEMLINMPAEVHHGKKIVEVSSMQVNKGIAMTKFASAGKYDLVLCAGDDQTDESMFRIQDKKLFKIKVGSGPTAADYRIDSCDKFIDFLNAAVRKIK